MTQTPPVRLGKKVGRKPAFSADDVVAAALAEGIDRFTLAAVAKRLGVATAALYRVFGSRDELLAACLDVAAGEFAPPDDGADWRDVLRRWADESWSLCERYPGLTRAVYSYPPSFTRLGTVLAAYADALRAQGWTGPQAGFALDFIGDTVFATHLGVEAMRATDDDGVTGLDRVRAELPDGSVLTPDESWSGRGAMDTKVAFIIAGLEDNRPDL